MRRPITGVISRWFMRRARCWRRSRGRLENRWIVLTCIATRARLRSDAGSLSAVPGDPRVRGAGANRARRISHEDEDGNGESVGRIRWNGANYRSDSAVGFSIGGGGDGEDRVHERRWPAEVERGRRWDGSFVRRRCAGGWDDCGGGPEVDRQRCKDD